MNSEGTVHDTVTAKMVRPQIFQNIIVMKIKNLPNLSFHSVNNTLK